uniref:NADH dehydrogenase subunit 4L n=1 Tax=Nipponacmea moskalevi TaxID=1357978 RepID=UPI00286A9FA7|nr:NADH dehydrogenase subunit 4L [Nipponacmea moskalevi]WKR34946.1 NADH dehydrogenase subunit 4L [Nipponacmea moskalevi]
MVASAGSLGVMLFLSGAIGLVVNNMSLLMALLYLEVCNVGTLVLLVSSVGNMVSPVILMLFLCMVVSEAAVGLAVLVMMAHSHGSDYMTTVGVLTY